MLQWCQNGTTVIEFPLVPMTNRNMPFLSMMSSIDYYMLPQISTNFYAKFEVDQAGVDAAIRLLKHIIKERGLEHILRNRDEF